MPVGPLVKEFADLFTDRPGLSAVLFYGSCLHQSESQLSDHLLDFYLLTEENQIGESPALQWAGFLLPPNVFYKEAVLKGGIKLRAKYAVMSLASFNSRAEGKNQDCSIWARFAQPARLIWVKNEATRIKVADACAAAVKILLQETLPLASSLESNPLWTKAFSLTYGAELRSERSDRAHQVVMRDEDRYSKLTPLLLLAIQDKITDTRSAKRRWQWRRCANKTLNILRLLKAVFTFQGGLTYILWKIERHSGIHHKPTQWQLRHPILAAPFLAWILYRKGAFK